MAISYLTCLGACQGLRLDNGDGRELNVVDRIEGHRERFDLPPRERESSGPAFFAHLHRKRAMRGPCPWLILLCAKGRTDEAVKGPVQLMQLGGVSRCGPKYERVRVEVAEMVNDKLDRSGLRGQDL